MAALAVEDRIRRSDEGQTRFEAAERMEDWDWMEVTSRLGLGLQLGLGLGLGLGP